MERTEYKNFNGTYGIQKIININSLISNSKNNI